MHLGQISSLGETAAYLIRALANLVGASDRESRVPDLLKQHAFSLRFGLPPSLEIMHRQLGSILSRSDFCTIYNHGIETPEELDELSEEDLAKMIVNEQKLLTIRAILNKTKEEVDMHLATTTAGMQVCSQPLSIEIDGSFETDRFLVRIDGFPVRLTGKSFKYFVKLAWSRLYGENGWIFKEDIEIGFNQARYLYRMKNEISECFASPWSVVENNRLGYYRLNIAPDRIRVNLDNLRNHPDYEVRSLMEIGGREAVN